MKLISSDKQIDKQIGTITTPAEVPFVKGQQRVKMFNDLGPFGSHVSNGHSKMVIDIRNSYFEIVSFEWISFE